MEVDYDRKVKKAFTDYKILQTKAGTFTRMIKNRINQLEAADTYGDFISLGIGGPHNLKGDLKGYCGVTISGNFRLVIQPCVDKMSPGALAKCDSIIVKGVVDYHGDKYNWIIP